VYVFVCVCVIETIVYMYSHTEHDYQDIVASVALLFSYCHDEANQLEALLKPYFLLCLLSVADQCKTDYKCIFIRFNPLLSSVEIHFRSDL
jgi:hypothetical protein